MLILLDIDGVMVPANSWRRPEILPDGFPAFTVKAVNALNRTISETHAKIVLTTSHKFKYTLTQWRDIFKDRGIVVDNLTRLDENMLNQSRSVEIINWFNKQPAVHSHNYVIIDDDKMLNNLPLVIKKNLVLTSSSVGLTDEDATIAIENLKRAKPFLAY